MRTITTVLAIAGLAVLIELAAARQSSLAEWQQYKLKHGKVYANKTEDAQRFTLFLAAKDKIARHNSGSSVGHKLGLNHLSDWTPAEFAKLNGLRYDPREHRRRLEASKDHDFLRADLGDIKDLPKQVDWRNSPGRVTPVKNQGECGSCWAFATTGLLEAQEFGRRKGQEVPLSEQDLVECSKNNHGCNGGVMSAALDDIQKMGGIESESDYPYTGPLIGDCRFNKSKVSFSDMGSKDLPANNEEILKLYVAIYGPVAIGVAANEHLQHYQGGVFNDPMCTKDLNHGVLLVGYGTDTREGDFWIVKNSWGAQWGEEGYFRIKRGVGMCGVGLLSTIATF